MAKNARNEFLDSIVEVYDSLLGAMEATEARGHKVSRTLLAEARRGERDVEALARKWIDDPPKLSENIGAAIDLQMQAERQALELARESLAGGQEYRQQVRESLVRVIAANRHAAAALARAARQGYPRTQAAGQRLRRAATSRLRPGVAAPPKKTAKRAVKKAAPRRVRGAKAAGA
jgi:hypothetical protein